MEKKFKVVFTQEEIDALWLLTDHIGGDPSSYRGVFSGHRGSIKDKFQKFVTPALKDDAEKNPAKYCEGEITFDK